MNSGNLLGPYRHYKGGQYDVLGFARHSETEEELVVYSSASGEWWVRPRQMFFEMIVSGDEPVQRFSPEKQS